MKTFKQFIQELEEERSEPVLFHHTSIHNAASILKDKRFSLSTGVGTQSDRDERQTEKHPYFLSTARNPSADYASHNTYRSGVQFELDKNHLQSRHKIIPKNYWNYKQGYASNSDKIKHWHTSEQEDRVLHHEPHINFDKNPSKLVKAVHVFHDFSKEGDLKDHDHQALRHVMLHAKKNNIPVHFYDNQEHFISANKEKSKPLSSVLPKLKGTPEHLPSGIKPTDYLKHYRELHHQTDPNKLSSKASSLLRYGRDSARSMEADIHNAAKRSGGEKSDLHKTISVMQANKAKTPKEYLDKMREKWTKIRGY